jgi:glycosyltransferase involved in cell wall biosynthesis
VISVIIPTRLDRKMLCMESIKNQTYKEMEIIVLPDFHNKGPAFLRNEGAAQAHGEELFFCDDDVVLRPECLEQMLWALNKCMHAGFVYCDYCRGKPFNDVVSGVPWNYETLKMGNFASTMSLVKKTAFEEVHGFDVSLKRFQDWDLWLRIGERHYGVHSPFILFKAYYDENSISISTDKEEVAALNIVKEKHGI